MKKSLVKIAAAMSAAAILTLAACSNPETPGYNFNSDAKVDTVLNLASPEVKVTAYPGMNYVSWSPVANAKSYVLYIYEEGSHIKTVTKAYNDELNYADTKIQNNKNYKYVVEAESKSSTGRTVVTENSISSPVTVKAIVPAYETSPLELYKFESDSKSTDYVVSAENINVYKDAEDTIAVSFPGKAYLTYDVYYSIDNAYETLRDDDYRTKVSDTTLAKAFVNNSIMHANQKITTPGKYHIIVDAKAANKEYGKTDTVISEKTIEVETLTGSGAYISSAKYKDDDTIRVEFTGFTFPLDGSVAPAEYYKIYRSVNYRPNVAPTSQNFVKPTLYTPVSGTVKATDVSATKFFVEDEIEDNTVAYTYTLVVTDGTRFAEVEDDMRNIVKARFVESTFGTSSIQPSAKCLDNDDYDNDIEWTITLPVTGITINDVYYLEKDSAEGHTVVAADFVKDAEHKVSFTTAGDETGKVYKAFTKDHTPGTDVYLLACISAEGYKDAEVVSRVWRVYTHGYSDPVFTSYQYDNYVDGATKADYERVPNDVIFNITQNFYDEQLDDFEFAIYEATPASITKSNNNITITWDFETADWKLGEANTKLQEVFKNGKFEKKNNYKDEALNEYCAVVELENLNSGLYAWKLVRTNKATGEVYVSQIETASVAGKAPTFIEYKPEISANFSDRSKPLSSVKVTFTKDNTANEYIKGEAKGETGILKDRNVDVVSEKEESGVIYSVYRTTIVGKNKDSTKVVWTYAGKVETATPVEKKEDDTKTCFRLDENGQLETFNPTYDDSILYTFADKELSTGNGYRYVVVCEKAGCAPLYSNVTPINPIN